MRATHLEIDMIRHAALPVFCIVFAGTAGAELTYPIVDTGQTQTFDTRRAIAPPRPGQPFRVEPEAANRFHCDRSCCFLRHGRPALPSNSPGS